MASPQSERATSDQKPVESTPAKEESKPETNGHTSPCDKPTEAEEAPAVNGNGKHDDEAKAANDAEVKSTKDTDTSPKETAAGAEADASPKDPTSKTAEGETKEVNKPGKSASPAPAETPAEPPKDVEMADATEATTEKKSEEKPEEKSEETKEDKSEEKVAEASEPAKSASETKEDVEMSQDNDQVNGTKKDKSSPALSAAAGQEVDLHPASMSQLAIDGNEDKSAATVDTDVSMTEAPSTASKVSREREDDTVDGEPAPKRAKTDPKEEKKKKETTNKQDVEEEASGSQTAASTVEVKPQGDLAKGESALDDLPLWNDPERDPKPLTSHQTREFRKVLAGVKKTKHGAHFKDAVAKLWPGLADSYVMRVKNPMDIGELERNLRDNKYSSLRKFKDDLGLIYQNSVTFNGVSNEITSAAFNVVKLAWTRVVDIPSDEPAKAKPVPKPSRHSDPRPPAPPPPAPRQPSVTAATPPAKTEAAAYAVRPGGVPQVRRASTQNDLDRPKRAIQPTKNRDPDYSAKNFNKKKLSVELQFCFEVLSELMDPKNAHCNLPFLAPVDPVALAIPTYFTIIKHPMDLGTIMSKLKNYDIQSAKHFHQDVRQVFKNCYKFNQPGQPVYEQGQELDNIFKNLWSKKEQWISKHMPAKAASEDSARDSEGEEEEEEEEAPAAPAEPATNQIIQMLEKRLQEETESLAQLYRTADSSSEAMIDLQQSVISTVRQRIMQEKANLPASKPAKGHKPKPSKSSKPKPSGAPSKKSAPAAPAKKSGSGGGSKKHKQRNMTQPEKDAIANAINDLESPHIERAIDIIKKDTGQSENSSGELELEIDQLTNEALHKLWDLCKKALPNFGHGLPVAAPREVSPVTSAPAKSSSKPSKPKKNKPMNAQEQEARIAELERLRNMFGKGEQGDQEQPGSSGLANQHPLHGDSESSDSEEE